MLSSPSFISAGHVGSITVIPSARGLNMRNSPLDGLSVDALSIDMTNAYLDTYALNGLHVHDVTLFNFMKAHVKPFVNRAGLGMNSFAGCDVERLCVLSD